MFSWLNRLHIGFILSPALMLIQSWILACSNGFLYQSYGLTKAIGLVVISSVVEANVIVMAITKAIQLWQSNSK